MKLYNLISKIVALGLIFLAPCIIVLQRYTTETTTQTITTTSSLGVLPTIFIITVVFIALVYVSSQLKEMIRQSKFGWLSILFYGLFLGLTLFGVWFIFNAIVLSVQANVQLYIDNMSYHRQTVFYMLYPIGGGIAVGVLSKLITLDFLKKLLATFNA